jgi:hypothetical protein
MIEDYLEKIRLEAQLLRESLRICRERFDKLDQENLYLNKQVEVLLKVIERAKDGNQD